MRRDVRDMWISTLLLTLAISLPLFFSGFDELTQYIISLIVELIIVWYFGTRLAKAGAFDKRRQEINTKNLLLLLPLCIAFLGRPIMTIMYPERIISSYSDFFWLYLLQAILTTLSEEMFFRMIIYNRLRTRSRLLRILASAGICALFEIINFFQTFDVLYTVFCVVMGFVLGIFLGFLREYTGSIYPCMVYHFVYLFLTNTIMYLYMVGAEYEVQAILIYGLQGVALIYAAIIYLVYFRKREVRLDDVY